MSSRRLSCLSFEAVASVYFLTGLPSLCPQAGSVLSPQPPGGVCHSTDPNGMAVYLPLLMTCEPPRGEKLCLYLQCPWYVWKCSDWGT